MSLTKSSHESPAGAGTDKSDASVAASVQCSDQALVAPKTAAKYKQWSLDSKGYDLEMLDKFIPASAQSQFLLLLVQIRTQPHLGCQHKVSAFPRTRA
jgi:hypothetical protein